MRPILLIHGYSAESSKTDAKSVTRIYGSLPADLRKRYGDANVFELDVSRYISLDDGINLDDLATAMDRALSNDYEHLLNTPFDVIIHSTGALVVRNWIRLFSKKPSPVHSITYLAAANFGSGWAHIGRGQLAKWGRAVFTPGQQRGVRVLNALELGSSETMDLHRFFLAADNHMYRHYKVREFCIVGSQVMRSWLPVPIRFIHEDGSDGVVRVASCNTNLNYVPIVPIKDAYTLDWQALESYDQQLGRNQMGSHHDHPREYYRVSNAWLADEADQPLAPLAITYECAHSGDNVGIVRGKDVRSQIMKLLETALAVNTDAQYQAAFKAYADHTSETYKKAASQLGVRLFRGLRNEPRQQYDPHLQVIFRLRDQYGQPVEHYDVFFDTDNEATFSINRLFEHTHKNTKTPGIIVYYLRAAHFNQDTETWDDLLGQVPTVNLEVMPVEPKTDEIAYLPLHIVISAERLLRFIQPHRTTIIDITLLRLPSPRVFGIFPAKV